MYYSETVKKNNKTLAGIYEEVYTLTNIFKDKNENTDSHHETDSIKLIKIRNSFYDFF